MVLWSTHRYILSFICKEKNEIGRSYVLLLLLLFPHQRHEWLPWLLTRISFLTLDRLQFHVKGVFDSPNDIDEEKSQDKKNVYHVFLHYKPTFKSIVELIIIIVCYFILSFFLFFYFFWDRLYAINHSKSSIVVVVGGWIEYMHSCSTSSTWLLESRNLGSLFLLTSSTCFTRSQNPFETWEKRVNGDWHAVCIPHIAQS